eukprot:5102390-Prymnesium_polylepis.1
MAHPALWNTGGQADGAAIACLSPCPTRDRRGWPRSAGRGGLLLLVPSLARTRYRNQARAHACRSAAPSG